MTDTKLNFNIGTVNAWFPVYVNLEILRDAKRRNRQRRLEKVKKTWAISVQMYKILGKGAAKAAKQAARKYGVPKFVPDIPCRVDCVGYIPGIEWRIGSAADLNEGFVLLKKEEGDTDANT